MNTASKEKYIEGTGRRKSAVARVRITPSGRRAISINERELSVYFPNKNLQRIVLAPLEVTEGGKFKITALIKGGGISAQAVALRHGISRALVKHEHTLRRELKVKGFLTRDQRSKERRKFGHKKARKSSQWSKR